MAFFRKGAGSGEYPKTDPVFRICVSVRGRCRLIFLRRSQSACRGKGRLYSTCYGRFSSPDCTCEGHPLPRSAARARDHYSLSVACPESTCFSKAETNCKEYAAA